MHDTPTPSNALSSEHAKMVQTAKKYRIPLHEEYGVIDALARLDTSERIPTELYGLFAEVISFVYQHDAVTSLPPRDGKASEEFDQLR